MCVQARRCQRLPVAVHALDEGLHLIRTRCWTACDVHPQHALAVLAVLEMVRSTLL